MLQAGTEDQGAIPTDAGMGEGFDRDAAMEAVQAALAYGRQQVAGNMPTIPGTQSESGIPPERPQQGRLSQPPKPQRLGAADTRPIPYTPNAPGAPKPEVPGTGGSGLIKQIRGGTQRTAMNDDDGDEQSFADGGAVEEEDDQPDPTSEPAIPVDGTENGEYPTGMRQEYAGPRTGMRAPHMMLRDAGQKIMSYLMGSGAAPAQEVAAAEQQADPEGQLDPADRKLMAVQQAGSPEKGWSYIQHYRQKYDAYKAHAAAALSKGDLGNAAQSLTQAYQNMPDGYSIRFTPDTNGLRADMLQGDKLVKSQNFNPQQLSLFARSPQAMFDNVLSKGSATLFSSLGTAHQVQGAAPQQGAPQQPQQAQAAQQGGDADEAAIEARANKIFPMVSQESQRQQWIADQLGTSQRASAANQAKVDAAKATAAGRIQASENYSGSRERVATINSKAKLQEAAQRMAATAKTAQERNQANIVRQALQSAPLGLDINQFAEQMRGQGVDIRKFMGGTPAGGAPQAPAAEPKAGQQQGDRFWRDAQGNVIGRKW